MSLSNFKIPIEIKSKIKFPGRQLRVGLGQIIFNELMPFRLWMKGTSGRKKFFFYVLHIQIIKWITQRNERNLLRREMQNIQDDWFILCTHQNSYFQIYNTNNVAIKVNPGVSLPYVFYWRLKDLCIKNLTFIIFAVVKQSSWIGSVMWSSGMFEQ